MGEVRLARQEDCPAIFALLKIRHEEDGGDTFDTEKVLNCILAGIHRKGALIGVIRGPERIEASIGLFLESEWYSSVPRVVSRWDFVHPDHRRCDHAKQLVIHGKQWASQLNCPLEIRVADTPQTKRKIEMMGRHMPRGGQTFVFPAADIERKSA